MKAVVLEEPNGVRSACLDDGYDWTKISVADSGKEAARRAAAKLRKLAAEFEKIAEGEK